MNNNKIIKICIIGAGRAGKFHVNSLLINKQYKLLYIIDKDIELAEKLSNIANCKYHNNLDYLLKTIDFDAIIIATTTNTHYDLTIKCLKFNKHVLCEKPIGKNEEEIEDCFKLAEINNLKLLIAYQKRFDKNYNDLYNLLKNEKNKPNNIHIINKDYPLPDINYLKTSNGLIEDMLCHDIDIINLYMNFEIPEKVVAFTYTHNILLKKINEIEGAEVMIQYKEGQIITFSALRNSNNGYDQRIELSGDFGMYLLNNNLDNTIIKHDIFGGHSSKNQYSFVDRYKDAYINELNYFYNMIVFNYDTIIKKDELILTKKICNAINESIKTKQIIYF